MNSQKQSKTPNHKHYGYGVRRLFSAGDVVPEARIQPNGNGNNDADNRIYDRTAKTLAKRSQFIFSGCGAGPVVKIGFWCFVRINRFHVLSPKIRLKSCSGALRASFGNEMYRHPFALASRSNWLAVISQSWESEVG